MTKKILIGILVIIAVIIVLGSFGEEEKPIIEPGSKGDVNLFTSIHQEKYLNDKDLEFISTHYDLVLMAFPFKEYVDKLREHNSDIVILHFNNPYFAYGEKFWDEGVKVEEAEPRWLLRTEDEKIIYFDGSVYKGTDWGKLPLMDIRNKEWQQYYAEQSRKWIESSDMDGLFIDTFSEEYQFWALAPDNKFAKGYTEEGWRQSNIEFLNTLKKVLGEDCLIVYNGISDVPGSSFNLPNIRFLKDTDGTAYEAFSVYLNMDKNAETKKYFFEHAIMTAMKKVVDEDKIFIIQVTGKNNNEEARLYALVSFLLLQNDKTYFYYAPDEAKIYWYPEWEIKTGSPLGEYYQRDGVYQRDFSNAKVIVNPSEYNIRVSLDKVYVTIEGEKAKEVNLPPLSGIILFRR